MNRSLRCTSLAHMMRLPPTLLGLLPKTDTARSSPTRKLFDPLYTHIPAESAHVHPLSHSSSANSFLQIPPPPRLSLDIPPSLHLQTKTSPPSASVSFSEPPSPSCDSPSYSRSPHSPAWFGASLQDQIDASFHRDAVDIPITIDEEKKDVFSRRESRLGKATYLVALSARIVEPTVQLVKGQLCVRVGLAACALTVVCVLQLDLRPGISVLSF